MNRVLKFGVYFLIGLVLFSIFTAVLSGGGGGGEVLDGSNSDTASTVTPTTTPERGDEYYTQEIADRLSNSNITVLSVGVKNNVTTLRYVPKRPNESAVVEEIGTISIQYSSLIRNGWNVSKLEAKVIPPRERASGNSSNSTDNSSQSGSSSANNSPNQSSANDPAETNRSVSSTTTSNESREPVASWHVKSKWVADMGGDNTSQKYLENILNSIELEGPLGPRGRGRGDQESSASGADRFGRAPDYSGGEGKSTSECEPAENRRGQCTNSNGNDSTTVVFGNES
ncbi:hypothetical protein [Halococcus sp. PRR34]|uniref:hypothetical protein n=1 Tax=Halococcus sp. PRR34 TaxID=3020830 RepID=UPI0023630755|nr:hypothetical protein [Halococcus sp. PRR34]